MNLERGETVYYRLLQLDMFGIWMSQSFGEYRVSCRHEAKDIDERVCDVSICAVGYYA